MENKFEIFMETTWIINHLIEMNSKEIVEMYENIEYGYELFLCRIVYLIKYKSGFLYVSDEIIQKIITVLGYFRFKEENKENNALCNDIVTSLNEILNTNKIEKEQKKRNFMIEEGNLRSADYKDDIEEFFISISNDAYLLSSFKNGNIDNINDLDFLTSTFYFMRVMPVIYKDKNIKELSIAKLHQLDLNPVLKLHIKKIAKKIDKI